VSHNLPMVERLCRRSVVLHEGTMRFDGPTLDAISTLHSLLDADETLPQPGAASIESGVADVTRFAIVDGGGAEVHAATTGDRLTAQINVRAHHGITKPFVGLTIDGPKGEAIFHQGNRARPFPALSPGEDGAYTVSWNAQVPTGSYVVRAFLGKVDMDGKIAVLSNATPVAFFVQGKRDTHGVVDVEADFATAD
jgi:hypothetical protein